MIRYISRLRRFIRYLGIRGTLAYILAERPQFLSSRFAADRNHSFTYHLFAKVIPFALQCRANTSDRTVFWQIFVERNYDALVLNHQPEVIFDCGAYVGYSTAYFLSRYPEATVIAVEPDPDNYAILKQNTAPFGQRVVTLNSAIWSEDGRLKLIRKVSKWTTCVEANKPEEFLDDQSGIDGVNLETLLRRYNLSHIDILKVDIEGAEKHVFSINYQTWLDKVDVIMIELHGKEARDIFFRSLSDLPFNFSGFGEVTIAQRQV
jgi:FkbM family methyltransferase